MLWTGWPPRQIMQLRPSDVDWTRATAIIKGRRKGRTQPDQLMPMLPPAMVALQQFAAVNAWGAFQPCTVRQALDRSLAKENAWRGQYGHGALLPIRVYDTRHFFGTEIARVITDDRVLAYLLMSKQLRYSRGALADRLDAAMATLSAQFPAAALAPSSASSDVVRRRQDATRRAG